MANPVQPTPSPQKQSTPSPQKKVIAATGGAAVGSALATLILFLLKRIFGEANVPAEVSGALNVIFTSIFTLSAGYYTPPAASEGTIVDPNDGSTKSATTG